MKIMNNNDAYKNNNKEQKIMKQSMEILTLSFKYIWQNMKNVCIYLNENGF